MKPTTVLTASILLALSTLQAQGPDTLWTRTYGGSGSDVGQSVQQTSDGGFVVAGSTESFGAGESDIYLIRTDAQGNTLWTRTYGGGGIDWGNSVQQTADGGFVVAGHTSSFGAGGGDVYLIRTDAQGDTLWTRTYGGSNYDVGFSVQQATDSGYVIAGFTESFGTGGSAVWLIKTNAAGDTLWTRTFGGSNYDECFSVQQTADGGYIIAGQTSSFGAGDYDTWLIRTDAQGDTLWTRTYGGSDWDGGRSVQQTSDGGFVVAGYTNSFGAGDYDIWLIRTDAQGDTLWTRTYGGSNVDMCRSVQQTLDGGFVVAGWTKSFGAGDYDTWLIRTDAQGDTLWTRTYGGSGHDFCGSVQQTLDGGFVMVGLTESFGAGAADVWLIKTDSLGNTAPLAIDHYEAGLPAAFLLEQNYPNPFNPATTLRFDLPQAAVVRLTIYDLLGREVARLLDQRVEPGYHRVTWNGRDRSGREVPTGVYIARLATAEYAKSIKLILLK